MRDALEGEGGSEGMVEGVFEGESVLRDVPEGKY